MIIKSKALKDLVKNKKAAIYEWWILSKLVNRFYNLLWFLEKPFRQLKKLYDWQVNVFKNDYDFDGHCLFAIIEYKLIRILPQLINVHAVQEDRDIKSLKLAIKLAGRLKNDDYDSIRWDRHDKKWGDLITWTVPYGDKGFSQYRSKRTKAVTPEQKELESKDRLAGMVVSQRQRKREEKWLYDILYNHLRNWWD